MRLKKYLSDNYIGLIDKNEKSNYNIPNRETKNLLKELNNLLNRELPKSNMKFSIIDEYNSPIEVLENVDERKLERITRKWMKLSNKFEELKENYISSLQND